MKPDCLVVWPQNTDFPLWRQFIHDNRNRLSKVVVVFTDMQTDGDRRRFIEEAMKRDTITFTNNDKYSGERDWRDVAVNKGLQYSDSEWVWFTEQDFFPREGFWEEAEYKMNNFPNLLIGADIGGRLHPCCLFVRRVILELTHKDFSARPPEHDHFGQIQKDIPMSSGISNKLYTHLNGLSQNMWLLQHGQEPNYQPEQFKDYCKDCLAVEVPIQEDIEDLFQKYVS